MAVLPGAEPYCADGGPIGVLVSHGFTGTPASVRPWAEYLAAAGYTVRLPLLPGHGTRWQDANRTGWRDWYGAIEEAYDELAARCDTVFAMGLSMGGTLVTRLAERKGDAIAGLVLVNPSYATERFDARFARWLKPLVKSRSAIGSDIHLPDVSELSYDRTPVAAFASLQEFWSLVLADLGQVTAPVLLYRSLQDHVVEPLSAKLLHTRATATDVHEIVLPDSYHVATMDYDAPQIFAGSVQFIKSITGAAVGNQAQTTERSAAS